MTSTALTCLLVLGGLVLSCRSRGAPEGANPPDSAVSQLPGPTADSVFSATGQIRFVDVEGGCWRFDTPGGTRYEISRSSAPEGLLTDGKQVTLRLRPRPDLMSTCMIGQLVEIVGLEP